MKPSFLPVAALAASLTVAAFAAEPSTDPKKKEEALPAPLAASPAAAPQDEPRRSPTDEAGPKSAEPAAPSAAAAPAEAPKPDEPTTLLPQVEVNKSRITNLDIEIQAQNQAIAREKANTKPTKLDNTLNGPGVSKALAIFGGSSSDQRSSLAKERISMMEEEKELIESMKLARTKEEKDELQKEIDALRATRRELDLAPK